MADTDTQGAQETVAEEPSDAAPGIQVLAQFVRDLSFENPLAPTSLQADSGPPKIDMQVELNAARREDGLFEVDLKVSVSATRAEAVAFHVELVYGGLFQIIGVEPDNIEPVLLIECPRFLFPFARQIMANITAEGGFPPFRMEPLDFAAIYMSRRQQLAQNGAGHA